VDTAAAAAAAVVAAVAGKRPLPITTRKGR
jgi:hypothetical protein